MDVATDRGPAGAGRRPPRGRAPGHPGRKLAPSTKNGVPRRADAPWARECKTWKTIDVNGARQLIMGEGINFYIRDELWDRNSMRVHMDRYHPVGRMFADRYCRTDASRELPQGHGAAGRSGASGGGELVGSGGGYGESRVGS